jgi:hypothetical protein
VDVATALTGSDMFDFLIDIVPREEARLGRATGAAAAATATAAAAATGEVSPARAPSYLAATVRDADSACAGMTGD